MPKKEDYFTPKHPSFVDDDDYFSTTARHFHKAPTKIPFLEVSLENLARLATPATPGNSTHDVLTVWTTITKTSQFIKNGARLENISWRLVNRGLVCQSDNNKARQQKNQIITLQDFRTLYEINNTRNESYSSGKSQKAYELQPFMKDLNYDFSKPKTKQKGENHTHIRPQVSKQRSNSKERFLRDAKTELKGESRTVGSLNKFSTGNISGTRSPTPPATHIRNNSKPRVKSPSLFNQGHSQSATSVQHPRPSLFSNVSEPTRKETNTHEQTSNQTHEPTNPRKKSSQVSMSNGYQETTNEVSGSDSEFDEADSISGEDDANSDFGLTSSESSLGSLPRRRDQRDHYAVLHDNRTKPQLRNPTPRKSTWKKKDPRAQPKAPAQNVVQPNQHQSMFAPRNVDELNRSPSVVRGFQPSTLSIHRSESKIDSVKGPKDSSKHSGSVELPRSVDSQISIDSSKSVDSHRRTKSDAKHSGPKFDLGKHQGSKTGRHSSDTHKHQGLKILPESHHSTSRFTESLDTPPRGSPKGLGNTHVKRVTLLDNLGMTSMSKEELSDSSEERPQKHGMFFLDSSPSPPMGNSSSQLDVLRKNLDEPKADSLFGFNRKPIKTNSSATISTAAFGTDGEDEIYGDEEEEEDSFSDDSEWSSFSDDSEKSLDFSRHKNRNTSTTKLQKSLLSGLFDGQPQVSSHSRSKTVSPSFHSDVPRASTSTTSLVHAASRPQVQRSTTLAYLSSSMKLHANSHHPHSPDDMTARVTPSVSTTNINAMASMDMDMLSTSSETIQARSSNSAISTMNNSLKSPTFTQRIGRSALNLTNYFSAMRGTEVRVPTAAGALLRTTVSTHMFAPNRLQKRLAEADHQMSNHELEAERIPERGRSGRPGTRVSFHTDSASSAESVGSASSRHQSTMQALSPLSKADDDRGRSRSSKVHSSRFVDRAASPQEIPPSFGHALSPKAVRRQMLATELSDSLRKSLLTDNKLGKMPVGINGAPSFGSSWEEDEMDNYHAKGW